jgi:hypothetical protein
MLGLNGIILVLRKADFIVDSLNVCQRISPIAERNSTLLNLVQPSRTATTPSYDNVCMVEHNYIQRSKNMRYMQWRPEWNNAVVVAVLNKLNGMMGAVAIQKKSFRALCELS